MTHFTQHVSLVHVSALVLYQTVIRCCFCSSLRRMRLNGVLARLRHNYWQSDIPKINRTSYGITFTAMAPIFITLALGILIAISILFLECAFHRGRRVKLLNNILYWKQCTVKPRYSTTHTLRQRKSAKRSSLL